MQTATYGRGMEVLKLHVLVPELAFWCNLNRSEAHFGQKSKEHIKTIKKYCICMKATIFHKHLWKTKHVFFLESFALIRARAEPIWARMGPARARMRAKPYWKTHFFSNTCLSKIIVLDLHMPLLASFNVFFRFLAEIRFRTIMKLPEKTSLGTKKSIFRKKNLTCFRLLLKAERWRYQNCTFWFQYLLFD